MEDTRTVSPLLSFLQAGPEHAAQQPVQQNSGLTYDDLVKTTVAQTGPSPFKPLLASKNITQKYDFTSNLDRVDQSDLNDIMSIMSWWFGGVPGAGAVGAAGAPAMPASPSIGGAV